MESARKRKMHVDPESLHLQQLLCHNSLAECFTTKKGTKKKNKQHFPIMRRMTTAESIRAAGPLQQYVWLTLHIHI